MWDERYSTDDYIYGKEPNTFLAENVGILTGPVLSISEGEGRNAVFLAKHKLAVHAVDFSQVALNKAQALAAENAVQIHTELCDLADFNPAPETFNAVISIFAHLPSSIRAKLYPRLLSCLKPGGIILLEAYSEAQLECDTGGPKDLDLLMSIAKVKTELPNLEIILLQEIVRNVFEGHFHTGEANVVQLIARKIR